MSAIKPSAVLQYPTVQQYMTPAPHTIARHRSLATARKLTIEHHAAHLPAPERQDCRSAVRARPPLRRGPAQRQPHRRARRGRHGRGRLHGALDAPVGEIVETMIGRKLGSAVIPSTATTSSAYSRPSMPCARCTSCSSSEAPGLLAPDDEHRAVRSLHDLLGLPSPRRRAQGRRVRARPC